MVLCDLVSYDMASWWMQIFDPIKQVQLGANSGAGCCPFCTVVNTPSCKELHLWREYMQAEISGNKHPYSFSLISMVNSCYCPLHADLRLFGDSFMNYLAEIALHHNKLEEWVDVVKGCGVPGFNAVKADDGTCESTALQGGQCRRLRGDIEHIIEATGVGDTKWTKEDIGGATKQQCRALLKNKTRCTKKRQTNDICCGAHAKLRADKKRVAICPDKENVQWVENECGFKSKLTECAKHLNYVLDNIQKISPFYDDQYKVHILSEGRKMERPNMCVPLTCLEMQQGEGTWVSATRGALEQTELPLVRTSSTFQEHGHRHLHHRIVEVVERIATAGEQIEKLEYNLVKLAETWEACFTDESWTPYLHVVVCHTLPLMKRHQRLGHFSQQVVENFHKLVRWFYARTNREGGAAENVQESSYHIMQLFWGQKLLGLLVTYFQHKIMQLQL